VSAVVLQGDARDLPLPDDSVDLVVTSPPYFGLRSYSDAGSHYPTQIGAEPDPRQYVDALLGVTRELARVLKPAGSIFVNLGDRYNNVTGGQNGTRETGTGLTGGARGKLTPRGVIRRDTPYKSLLLVPERYRIACVDQLGLTARAVIVWSKTNAMPESVTDRVRRSHEEWVHLTRAPRYFQAVDQIREPHGPPTGGRAPRPFGTRNVTPRHAAAPDSTGWKDHDVLPHPVGRLPGSVWAIPTQPLHVPAELGVDHYAAFPMEWPRRLITGWCPPGGVVLDPFGGTGTTALVADVLGRTGITLDASRDYCRIARWRTTDPVQRARAAGNDTSQVARVSPDQGDLFGELVDQ
jgi:DNA modification methylase